MSADGVLMVTPVNPCPHCKSADSAESADMFSDVKKLESEKVRKYASPRLTAGRSNVRIKILLSYLVRTIFLMLEPCGDSRRIRYCPEGRSVAFQVTSCLPGVTCA